MARWCIIVGDGALDVPFWGVARFEIVQTMYANKGGRTLFAPTIVCGVIGGCVIFVLVMFCKVM